METIKGWAGAVEPSCRAVRRFLDFILIWLCIVMLIAMAFIIILAVFSRTIGSSLAWYDEVASNLLAWLTYYGAGVAVLRSAHLDFGAFVEKLPTVGKLLAMATAKLVVIAFFGVMLYAGVVLVELMEGETLISLEWVPMPLVESALPVGAALFILAELLTVPSATLAIVDGAPAGRE